MLLKRWWKGTASTRLSFYSFSASNTLHGTCMLKLCLYTILRDGHACRYAPVDERTEAVYGASLSLQRNPVHDLRVGTRKILPKVSFAELNWTASEQQFKGPNTKLHWLLCDRQIINHIFQAYPVTIVNNITQFNPCKYLLEYVTPG